MAKLYELNSKFLELQGILDELEDSPDVDLKEMIADSLESIEATIESKIENLIKLQKQYDAEADMFKSEKDRLQIKQKSAENKAENVKRFIEDQLKLLGYDGTNKKQLQAGLWKANIQKNAPSLVVALDAVIPKEYYRQPEPVLDKRELLDAVKNGTKIKGVVMVQTETIRIR